MKWNYGELISIMTFRGYLEKVLMHNIDSHTLFLLNDNSFEQSIKYFAEFAPANWANNMAANCFQQLKPLAYRSAF